MPVSPAQSHLWRQPSRKYPTNNDWIDLWGSNAGLINVGPIIGALIGAAFTYMTSDARLLGQAKHEGHGFAEPESRLPASFPGLFIATSGLFVFGFCAQYPGPKVWVGLEVGYAMLSFGLMQVPSIDFNYVSHIIPMLHSLVLEREALANLFHEAHRFVFARCG